MPGFFSRKVKILLTSTWLRRGYSAIGRGRAETIFAIASGAHTAAINVIRVSGDRVEQVIRGLVPSVSKQERLLKSPNQMHRCLIAHESNTLDEAMLVYFKSPRSFTGEDVLEIHSHGAPAIRKALLTALATLPGVRPAQPGEFSQRAFLTGKMGLLEAEALRDLISSQGELQRQQALRAYRGHTGRQLEEWRAQLIKALAILEAWIDFGEDEQIEPEALRQVAQITANLRFTMGERLERDREAEVLREGVRVAIGGLPNAGKSSLLNTLLGKRAAIVSPQAGTTRDPIERTLEVAGLLLHLVDTAGIRSQAAVDAIEAEGMAMAQEHLEQAHLVLLVIDASSLCAETVLPAVDPARTIILFNKMDLLPERELSVLRSLLPEPLRKCPAWPISLLRQDRSALLHLLTAYLQQRYASLLGEEPPLLVHSRHVSGIQRAVEYLALCEASLGRDAVAAAEHLRRAALEVGRLTGHIGADEVLDVLFSSFCIGK